MAIENVCIFSKITMVSLAVATDAKKRGKVILALNY